MPLLRPSLHPRLARLLTAVCLCMVGLAARPILRAADARQASLESEVKAAALYNIIQFSGWPTSAFADDGAPLVVAVLGRGPVADLIPSFVSNESWHGRRLVIERYQSADQVKDCHVLFVGQSEHAAWPALRSRLSGKPVLTVCDRETFARDGGVVQFGIERNKLRLTVNLGAARAAGLTISSKVLRLAEVVGAPAQ